MKTSLAGLKRDARALNLSAAGTKAEIAERILVYKANRVKAIAQELAQLKAELAAPGQREAGF